MQALVSEEHEISTPLLFQMLHEMAPVFVYLFFFSLASTDPCIIKRKIRNMIKSRYQS